MEVNQMDEELFKKYREGLFEQMRQELTIQLQKCEHYGKIFEEQNNTALAAQFATYATSTTKYFDVLEKAKQEGTSLPEFKYEEISFSAVPYNPEVKEKELHLTVRTQKLPENAQIQIVAEFDFDHRPGSTFTELVARWWHYATIDSRHLCSCFSGMSHQFDKIDMVDMIPFDDPKTEYKQYNRPITFHIDKGRSRTLKRKYKPVKLVFYRQRGLGLGRQRLGQALVKIDDVNDHAYLYTKQPIMNGRKETGGIAEIRAKVQSPLVNKSIRLIEDKLITFQ